MKLFTIILFAVTYILMIALPARCRWPPSLRPSTGTFF